MQDAIEEYKAQLKKVNPDFDVDHYDKIILGLEEPQTPTPEDPIGFDQLDPIGTLGNAAGPSTIEANAEASTSQATEQPADKPVNQPADPLAEQPTTWFLSSFFFLFIIFRIDSPCVGVLFVILKQFWVLDG